MTSGEIRAAIRQQTWLMWTPMQLDVAEFQLSSRLVTVVVRHSADYCVVHDGRREYSANTLNLRPATAQELLSL